VLDYYFFRLGYPGEVETEVPLKHDLDMPVQKPGLFFSERNTRFSSGFQDKIGEFITFHCELSTGSLVYFPTQN
jgi:hypothetical protein